MCTASSVSGVRDDLDSSDSDSSSSDDSSSISAVGNEVKGRLSKGATPNLYHGAVVGTKRGPSVPFKKKRNPI